MKNKYGYDCNDRERLKREYVLKTKQEPIENREQLLAQFLQHNHEDYLKKPLKIGTYKSFPESTDPSKISARITIPLKDANPFDVRLTKFTFGDNDEYEVSGIITDRFEIKRTGPMAGWGQHSYIDEAAIMNKAAIQLCKEQKLMICEHLCSWPYVKLIVQPVEDAHLRRFKETHDKKEA